jgi:hypothetical protein
LKWPRLQGADALAVRAAKRLRNDGTLITQFGGIPLRMELDKIPLWRGEHVSVKQLAEDFAQYLYLPRLRDSHVLAQAIELGVGILTWEQDTFAYAERYDETTGRYQGLRGGELGRITLESAGLVVKSEVARQQLERERQPPPPIAPAPDYHAPIEQPSMTPVSSTHLPIDPSSAPRVAKQRRYHGAARLEPLRITRDASQIADAIVQHLASLPGARVRITIEIEAEIPDGAPDHVVRTVTENSRTLKFESFGFEEE